MHAWNIQFRQTLEKILFGKSQSLESHRISQSLTRAVVAPQQYSVKFQQNHSRVQQHADNRFRPGEGGETNAYYIMYIAKIKRRNSSKRYALLALGQQENETLRNVEHQRAGAPNNNISTSFGKFPVCSILLEVEERVDLNIGTGSDRRKNTRFR